MGPIFTGANEWGFVVALIIGIAFGYILESAGFSSSRKLAGVFYGYDFVVLQVFFTAAMTAAVGLLYFSYLGWIDLEAIWVNKFYIGPTILGGAIMGLGFVIGGFCPGTSACAAAVGKIDAMIFLVGVTLGAVLFDLGYPLYSNFLHSGNMGAVKIYEQLGVSVGTFMIIFIVVALVAFVGTAYIQNKISKKTNKY